MKPEANTLAIQENAAEGGDTGANTKITQNTLSNMSTAHPYWHGRRTKLKLIGRLVDLKQRELCERDNLKYIKNEYEYVMIWETSWNVVFDRHLVVWRTFIHDTFSEKKIQRRRKVVMSCVHSWNVYLDINENSKRFCLCLKDQIIKQLFIRHGMVRRRKYDCI